MGTQTMSNQPGSGGGGSLSRQGSIYSLTLNEVQTHLGEPLHSMNLDELLRSVFPESAQPPETALDGGGVGGGGAGIRRQGSIAMPSGLSKKTVDEVWRDIQCSISQRGRHQATLGEMTLEDFLAKAGVMASDGLDKYTGWPVQQSGFTAFVGRPVPRPLGIGAGPILDAVYHDGGLGGAVSVSPVTPGRKRGPAVEGVVEKTVERRQKRMIKNRESAARSRARKQAYTNELENKISRLEEEIERLKKEKESEPVVHYIPQPEPKHQLRRTSSAPS